MSGKKIVVIGSGFGGLAEAIRLQSRGFSVTLIEKREKIGGRAYQFHKKGYTFDMGPSIITAPFILERVFEAAGKKMRDYLDLVPLKTFYRVYFHDGSVLDYSGDPESMKKQMAGRDPGDAQAYDRFFRDTKEIYDVVITDRLGSEPFVRWKPFLSFVPRALKMRALEPVYSYAKRYFKNEDHRFLFSFHPLFIGGSPFRSPSVYIMIPFLEREGGVWFARGGMYSLVKAYGKVFEEIGGKVLTSTPAEEIVIEDGKVKGVRTPQGTLEADAVVCNADIPMVYRHLVNARWRRKWTDRAIDRLQMSMSCFLLYLGTRKQFPVLEHHTLILGPRYRGLVEDIFDRKILPDDFSMYLHAPTRTDPSMAPPGCESLYVLVPVPNLKGKTDWIQEAEVYKEKILDRLERHPGLEGLRDSLEVCEMFTPLDFRDQLSSFLGNAFAIEPRLTQTAYFRPHNRSEDVKGLYFVGAGTHPGGGVPGTLLTAEATEKCILEDMG